ncbi:hypothetical protein [Streptomyces sp. NPDC102360]|uniref:hypothetical protein n=1 Tax=Streptomyces sp. NPDC102360 TaxID=3366160 RepID=UPI0038104F7E
MGTLLLLGRTRGPGVVERGDDIVVEATSAASKVAPQCPAGDLVGLGGTLQNAIDAGSESLTGFLLFANHGLAVRVVASIRVLGQVIARSNDARGVYVEVPLFGFDISQTMKVVLGLLQFGMQRKENPSDAFASACACSNCCWAARTSLPAFAAITMGWDQPACRNGEDTWSPYAVCSPLNLTAVSSQRSAAALRLPRLRWYSCSYVGMDSAHPP